MRRRPLLRPLDAIHLDGLAAYDDRLAAADEDAGITVIEAALESLIRSGVVISEMLD